MITRHLKFDNLVAGLSFSFKEFKLGVYMAKHAFQINLGHLALLLFQERESIEDMTKTIMDNMSESELLSIGWHRMEEEPIEGPILIAFYGKNESYGDTCDIRQGWMEDGRLMCETPTDGMKPFAWMHIELPDINPFETEDGTEGDEE